MSIGDFFTSWIKAKPKDIPKYVRGISYLLLILSILVPLGSWWLSVQLQDRYVDTAIRMVDIANKSDSNTLERLNIIQDLRFNESLTLRNDFFKYFLIFFIGWISFLLVSYMIENSINKKRTQNKEEATKSKRFYKSAGIAIVILVTWFGTRYFNIVYSWPFPLNILGLIIATLFLTFTIFFCAGDILDNL